MRITLAAGALMVVMAGSLMGQTSAYKKVGDRIVPKNSRDWRVFYDRFEVISPGAVLVCRIFTIQGSDGNIGRGVRTPGHTEQKVYGETFALKNYPGAGGFKPGDEIHGPIMAMPTTEIYRAASVYDYGIDYFPKVAPPKPPGPNDPKGPGTIGDPPKKVDATAAATFKFHLQKAESGDVGSQFRVAQLYLEGKGVPPSTNQAIVWFEKVKAQGIAPYSEDAASELKSLGK
jgi:hypothetical protein